MQGYAQIHGTTLLCVSNTVNLSEAHGSGTWSSSNTAVATVCGTCGTTGVLGLSTGTAGISFEYSPGNYDIVTVTVNPVVSPISYSGSNPICASISTANIAAITLSDATSGGTWSCTAPGYTYTITPTTGTGVLYLPPIYTYSVGTNDVTVTYLVSPGCHASYVQTVNMQPYPPNQASNYYQMCIPTGTLSLYTGTSGGTWSSSNTAIGSITGASGTETVTVTGVSAGTITMSYTINYTSGPNCYSTRVVTVNAAVPPITGALAICIGSNVPLSDAAADISPDYQWGNWTSTNTVVATIGPPNRVVGQAAGTTTITYLPYHEGVYSGCFATTTVSVGGGIINGTLSMCVGLSTTLTDAAGGGVWSSSSSHVTVGSSSGVITGVSSGTALISFTISGASTCPATVVVTVNPLPMSITGNTPVCAGSTITLSDATAGGTWSSGSSGIATIGTSSGVVTGIAAGTAVVTYTLSTGCISTITVTVNADPTIMGTSIVCVGLITTLSASPSGGTWSSSNSNATVDGSGDVTGVTSGTAIITYSLGTSCIATAVVTVNPLPSAITGTLSVCVGSITALSDGTAGGTWSDDELGYGSVDGSGNVTGEMAGTATISYTLGTGCYVTAIVTVNASPTISGNTPICLGSSETLSGDPTGGTWSSSNTSIATVDGSGDVTGVSGGTVTISYILGDGCYATVIATVNGVNVPNVGCYSDGKGNYAFINDENGYAGITVNYSVNLIDGATTVNALSASPLALSAGSHSFTYIYVSYLSGGYTSPPWSINADSLISVTYDGCTWPWSCGHVDRYAAGGNTGINQISGRLNAISVVPNPNNGAFTISGAFTSIATSKEARIELLDMLGKVVYRDVADITNGGINKDITLSSDIADGIYLIRVVSDDASKVLRFSLNR